jgi:hypothetical protein
LRDAFTKDARIDFSSRDSMNRTPNGIRGMRKEGKSYALPPAEAPATS